MSRMFRRGGIWACLLCLIPTASYAHSFGTPYILPIPFWMYVFGCAATLLVTFAVLGFFAGAPAECTGLRVRKMNPGDFARVVGRCALWVLRAGAAGCLLLTILAGIIGSVDPGRNIGMTLFWVLFLLGFTYLTLFTGDLYALVNPWRLAVDWSERVGLDLSATRVIYSPRLGFWPAFSCYVALIWVELFVDPKPRVLSISLVIYSAITIIGVTLFGKTTWFFRADLFSIFFRLIGKLAPVEYTRARDESSWRVCLRPPFAGALNEPPGHISLVLFVLFMLSSTSYDSIHDTPLWMDLFWRNLLWLSQPIWGGDLGKAQSLLMGSFLVYRQAGLLLFPFLYLGFYLLALLWTKALTRTTIPLRTLALDFCYSLIPIAVAYNFAHYYTFLVTEGRNLPWRVSDPFGFGWNLLGIPQNQGHSALQMGVVWHIQVAAILVGHVVSVSLAHNVATRIFPTQRLIIVSQLPLLLLMVAYTMVGLWILTLPLG